MTGKALILVDIQNDFLPPHGSLAVPQGEAILPCIYELLTKVDQYDLIVASLDCEREVPHYSNNVYLSLHTDHPKGHISFASTHSREPFSVISVPKVHTEGETVTQVLWPDHCIQDTPGCRIEEGVQSRLDALDRDKVRYIHKGTCIDVDAYSAFSDNTYSSFTPLAKILHQRGIEEVEITGLALDYCVKNTAIDSRKFNFTTRLLKGATRAVDVGNSERVLRELTQWGVVIS